MNPKKKSKITEVPKVPEHSSQFDFMFDAPAPEEKKPPFSTLIKGDGSKKQRIIVTVVGVIFLMILISIATTIIGNLNKVSYDSTIKIATLQKKMIQASEEAVRTSRTADVKASAATLNSIMKSDFLKVSEYLTSEKQSKKLKAIPSRDNTVKKRLATAFGDNNFDGEYKKIVNESVESYVAEIKKTLAKARTKSEVDLMNTIYQHLNDYLSSQNNP